MKPKTKCHQHHNFWPKRTSTSSSTTTLAPRTITKSITAMPIIIIWSGIHLMTNHWVICSVETKCSSAWAANSWCRTSSRRTAATESIWKGKDNKSRCWRQTPHLLKLAKASQPIKNKKKAKIDYSRWKRGRIMRCYSQKKHQLLLQRQQMHHLLWNKTLQLLFHRSRHRPQLSKLLPLNTSSLISRLLRMSSRSRHQLKMMTSKT